MSIKYLRTYATHNYRTKNDDVAHEITRITNGIMLDGTLQLVLCKAYRGFSKILTQLASSSKENVFYNFEYQNNFVSS